MKSWLLPFIIPFALLMFFGCTDLQQPDSSSHEPLNTSGPEEQQIEKPNNNTPGPLTPCSKTPEEAAERFFRAAFEECNLTTMLILTSKDYIYNETLLESYSGTVDLCNSADARITLFEVNNRIPKGAYEVLESTVCLESPAGSTCDDFRAAFIQEEGCWRILGDY